MEVKFTYMVSFGKQKKERKGKVHLTDEVFIFGVR